MTYGLTSLAGATWHCEPPKWSLAGGELHLTTARETDFWQDTYYGFHRDDGHFLGKAVSTDFTAIICFDGTYEALYDQAGLMMRSDERNWLKAGIEFSDGIANFSVVVTREGRSDWSVIPAPMISGPQKIRLTRMSNASLVHHLASDHGWRLMRLADFPAELDVSVGPMACSPKRAGFKARFLEFDIVEPVENPLHGA